MAGGGFSTGARSAGLWASPSSKPITPKNIYGGSILENHSFFITTYLAAPGVRVRRLYRSQHPPLGIEVSSPAASLHYIYGFHSESPSRLGMASGCSASAHRIGRGSGGAQGPRSAPSLRTNLFHCGKSPNCEASGRPRPNGKRGLEEDRARSRA